MITEPQPLARTLNNRAALEHLLADAPQWANVVDEVNSLLVTAEVATPSGGVWPIVKLKIEPNTSAGVFRVREFPKHRWPTFCPVRHINQGGYFCLGLSDVPTVVDAPSAIAWWKNLAVYLNRQFAAEKTGIWSVNHEWDHGAAGNTQFEMEAIAQDAKLVSVVRDAHMLNIGWLAHDLPRLTKSKRALTNGRAPCPNNCFRRSKKKLRRNCPNREAIASLVRLETLRRQQIEDYWKSLEGTACCNTMKPCKLRGAE